MQTNERRLTVHVVRFDCVHCSLLSVNSGVRHVCVCVRVMYVRVKTMRNKRNREKKNQQSVESGGIETNNVLTLLNTFYK